MRSKKTYVISRAYMKYYSMHFNNDPLSIYFQNSSDLSMFDGVILLFDVTVFIGLSGYGYYNAPKIVRFVQDKLQTWNLDR